MDKNIISTIGEQGIPAKIPFGQLIPVGQVVTVLGVDEISTPNTGKDNDKLVITGKLGGQSYTREEFKMYFATNAKVELTKETQVIVDAWLNGEPLVDMVATTAATIIPDGQLIPVGEVVTIFGTDKISLPNTGKDNDKLVIASALGEQSYTREEKGRTFKAFFANA
ncbi:MAG TPA: hypothetical protein EYH12_02890 [Psychromonas hadalis]|nr:hypothetical protein [Psychromonas hadalis]